MPDNQRVVRSWLQDSNYLQATEGEIDSAHISFNHRWFNMDAAPPARALSDERRSVEVVGATGDRAPTSDHPLPIVAVNGPSNGVPVTVQVVGRVTRIAKPSGLAKLKSCPEIAHKCGSHPPLFHRSTSMAVPVPPEVSSDAQIGRAHV